MFEQPGQFLRGEFVPDAQFVLGVFLKFRRIIKQQPDGVAGIVRQRAE